MTHSSLTPLEAHNDELRPEEDLPGGTDAIPPSRAISQHQQMASVGDSQFDHHSRARKRPRQPSVDHFDGTRPEAAVDTDSDTESRISALSDCLSDTEPLFFLKRSHKPTAPRSEPKPISGSFVTLETLENPRSVMSMAELEVLLIQRDLPRRKAEEDHATLVARLNQADNAMNNKTLNAVLREAYLPTSFNRAEKIRRLQKHDAEESIKGQAGIKSTDMEFKQSYEAYQLYSLHTEAV